jgi:hypothetical protein
MILSHPSRLIAHGGWVAQPSKIRTRQARRMSIAGRRQGYSVRTRRGASRPTRRIKAKIKQIVRSSLTVRTWSPSAPAWEELTMTSEDYFTNAVRMFLADGGTPESAHRLIDETATEPARAKSSRERVEGAPPSPATSEEIARAIREAFAGRPKIRKRQR